MKTTKKAYHITIEEIVDAPAFAARLRSGTDPVTAALRVKLSPVARAVIVDGAQPAAGDTLKEILGKELERILHDGLICSRQTLNEMTLSPAALIVWNKKPGGLDEAWLNLLLVREAFGGLLARSAPTYVAEWTTDGIVFTIYSETRKLKHGPGLSYKVFFETTDGPDSRHAKTLDLAPDLTQTLADEIHSGTRPQNKLETKERNANAAAYAAIIKEVARAGITKEDSVLSFIRDVVEAQLELGPLRPVRKFVTEAIPIMPKPEKRVWLSIALVGYEVFVNNQKLNSQTGRKLRAVKRFVREIAVCEKIGQEQIRDQLKANDPSLNDVIIDCLINSGTIPKKLLGKSDQPGNLYADEVTELGISIWLKSLRVGWRMRHSRLTYVRNFFGYLRDHLHAVPQKGQTVAHQVPLATREAKSTPIAILWPAEVWTILANLQDLDMVFFVAIGVYAGLHRTEILKLVWEYDMKEENGEFTQIFIASGQGKEPGAPREGKHVKIRYPLNQILALGKGRKGKVVNNRNVKGKKLRNLLKRLGISWSPSIMRHTTATFLNGISVPLTEVADQLRDRLATVLKYYIRQLSNSESRPMWTLPFEVSEFAKLKDRVRVWDQRCQLKKYQPNGTFVVEPAVPASSIKPKTRKPRETRVWPADPEFQVMLFEKTREEIAEELGCDFRSVCYHAKAGNFDKPSHINYWYRLKKGLPVERPESYYKAKAQVEAAKAKKLATAQSN